MAIECDAQRQKVGNLRLGAGLGAAGLASGFAASHCEELCWGGKTGEVCKSGGVGWAKWKSVGLWCRDDGWRAVVGAAGSL